MLLFRKSDIARCLGKYLLLQQILCVCYELITGTYGTTNAPYLATICLEQLAQLAMQTRISNVRIAEIIRNHTYMDNLLVDVETKDDILWFQREITKIFSEAGFELRKYGRRMLGIC